MDDCLFVHCERNRELKNLENSNLVDILKIVAYTWFGNGTMVLKNSVIPDYCIVCAKISRCR